jgi:hypothetical protein
VSDEEKVLTFVRILISVANPQQNARDRLLHGGADQTGEAFKMLRAKLPAETVIKRSSACEVPPPGTIMCTCG